MAQRKPGCSPPPSRPHPDPLAATANPRSTTHLQVVQLLQQLLAKLVHDQLSIAAQALQQGSAKQQEAAEQQECISANEGAESVIHNIRIARAKIWPANYLCPVGFEPTRTWCRGS